MKLSINLWSTIGLTLAVSAGVLLFANEVIGLSRPVASSLGSSALLGSMATLWGQDAFGPKRSASAKSVPRTIFVLFVIISAVNIWRALG